MQGGSVQPRSFLVEVDIELARGEKPGVSSGPHAVTRQIPVEGGDPDERWVSAFQAGERDAFDQLVRRYRVKVYWLCRRFTGNHLDADDLAQDVFLRAYQGLGGFRAQSRFSTWLYRIAVNVGLSWAAKQKGAPQPLSESWSDGRRSAADELSARELSRSIEEAIATLPEKQRMTLILRVYQELSYREIATIMESPLGTAKANMFFALKNLRKRLGGSSPCRVTEDPL